MEPEIRDLIQKNNEVLAEATKTLNKVKRYLFWGYFWSVVKILLVIVPLVVAIIYLPPLFSDFMKSYGNLLGDSNDGLGEILKGIDPNTIKNLKLK